MHCNDIQVLLATRKDLTPAQESAVRAHLAGCPACSAQWTFEEQTSRTLRLLPVPSHAIVAQVTHRTDQHLDSMLRPHGLSRSRLMFAGAVVAAVMLLVLIPTVRWPWLERGQQPPTTIGLNATTTPMPDTTPEPQAMPDVSPAPTAVAASNDPTNLLAYIVDGHLWIKALPDGPARELPAGDEVSQPLWSPSGGWIAYRRPTQLWIIRVSDGKTYQVGNEIISQFAWSPRVDRLAYISQEGSLRLVTPDPWQDQEVVPGDGGIMSGLIAMQFAWRSDGTQIAFDRQGVNTEGGEPRLYAGLWRVRVDGSDLTELYEVASPQGSGVGGQTVNVAAWDAASGTIVFWEPSTSASISFDGVPLMAIAESGGEPRQIVESVLVYDSFLTIAPDGTTIAVTAGSGRETTTQKRIGVLDLPDSTPRYLTDEQTAAVDAVWSGDGQQVAYVAAPDGKATGELPLPQRHIWVVQRDGSDPRQVTPDSEYRDERPRWLDGDTHILFARIDPQGNGSLWLMDRNGEAQEVASSLTLPEGEVYGHIRWEESFDLLRRARVSGD